MRPRQRSTTGCLTCRARRVKCDEGKPVCQRCLKVDRPCSYQVKRKSFGPCSQPSESSPATQPKRPSKKELSISSRTRTRAVSLPKGIHPAEEEQARAFFFFFFISLGTNAELTGHFDLIPSALSAERHDSALSLAFSTISMRAWQVWLHPRTQPSSQRIASYLIPALHRLQAAIDSPEESKRPGTILAALLLQYDETLSAIVNHHSSVKIHHEGAVALAQQQLVNSPSQLLSSILLHNALHGEIACALLQNTPVPPKVVAAVLQSGVDGHNIESKLDMISVGVANCQARFLAALSGSIDGHQAKTCLEDSDARLHAEAKVVLHDLLAWENSVPRELRPSRLNNVRVTEPPIITYSEASLVYPSINVAGSWNSWATRYLAILNILIATSQGAIAEAQGVKFESPSAGCQCRPELQAWKQAAQKIVDRICDTVPYHLGNLRSAMDRTMLAGAPMEFPSYHDIQGNPPQCAKFGLASRELHARHALAQGPWRLTMALAYLIPFLQGPTSWLSKTIRPGQYDWLVAQFRRAVFISRFCDMRTEASTKARVQGEDIQALVRDLQDRMRFTICV